MLCNQPKSLSIVTFVHNLSSRGVRRLRNHLYSLRNQEATILVPDIFVIDQSNDDSFDEVDSYCKEFNATHVYSHLEKLPWSKSLSLNAGIKMVKSSFVGCVDVDDIFAPNFLSIVEKEANEKKLLICKVWNSTPDMDLNSFTMKEFNTIREKSKFFKAGCANGACQLTSKNWFIKVKGYNEFFKMWGAMDNELVRIAQKTGLRVQWIHKQTSIVHQYHRNKTRGDEWKKLGGKLGRKNREFYRHRSMKTSERLKRNEKGWGNLSVSLINRGLE